MLEGKIFRKQEANLNVILIKKNGQQNIYAPTFLKMSKVFSKAIRVCDLKCFKMINTS